MWVKDQWGGWVEVVIVYEIGCDEYDITGNCWYPQKGTN